MASLHPADVDRLRDHLRMMEAKLDAMRAHPLYVKGDPEARAVMNEVHELRGLWRRAESVLGRRLAGMAVAGAAVSGHDLAKLTALVEGYKAAAERNTGKAISGDIADYEQRVRQEFGLDPNQTRLTKASSKAG